ncbi:hypothetical protein VH1709_contig00144-0001 [Vibrio harveyi]|nr:hypothetical protein VH1709_contig00144-0001 [Vibrio harveyi]
MLVLAMFGGFAIDFLTRDCLPKDEFCKSAKNVIERSLSL